MKIDTDLVKNKTFTSSINSHILKHSQEYRVLATLRYLFPQKFDKMILGEKPDIQDIENSIGIEVTAAVKNEDMKAASILSKIRKLDDKQKQIYINKIVSCGYSYDELKKVLVLLEHQMKKIYFKTV